MSFFLPFLFFLFFSSSFPTLSSFMHSHIHPFFNVQVLAGRYWRGPRACTSTFPGSWGKDSHVRVTMMLRIRGGGRGVPGVVGVPLLGGQVSHESWVTGLKEISTESKGKSQVRS